MKKYKLLKFKFNRALWQDLFWMYKSIYHWQWVEFIDNREYTVWDSVKNINWKLLARTNKLYVTKFEEEKNLNVSIILDINKTFYQWKEKLELLEEIFYSLAVTALQNNDNIYINNIYWLRWTNLLLKVINKLENKTLEEINLENIIENYAKNKHIKNNLVFILTDKDKIEKLYNRKIAWLKNDINFINIYHYFENNLENLPLEVWFINNNLLQIDLSDKKKIERYTKIRNEKINDLKKNLTWNKISYLYLDTKLNPYKELIKFFMNKAFIY